MFHHPSSPSFQPRPVRPGGATGASSQEAFGHSEALSRSTGAAELVSRLSLDGQLYRQPVQHRPPARYHILLHFLCSHFLTV